MANVQIRGVPDDVHRRLKSQAALAGQSLNEYLLAQVHRDREPADDSRAHRAHPGTPAVRRPVGLIREDRDRR
jgi:antitoxin FitA